MLLASRVSRLRSTLRNSEAIEKSPEAARTHVGIALRFVPALNRICPVAPLFSRELHNSKQLTRRQSQNRKRPTGADLQFEI
jgi:hypothetical protein